MPGAYGGLIAVVSFVSRYLVGPLLAGGCIAIALRQRMTSRWVWIGLGLIALASGLLGFQMHFIPPEGGIPGRTLFSAVGIVYLEGRPDLLATLGVAALRSTVLFVAATISYRALRRHFTSVLT
jgi:hypothetical protein